MITIIIIFKSSPPLSSSPAYALSFLSLPLKKHDLKLFDKTLVVLLAIKPRGYIVFD